MLFEDNLGFITYNIPGGLKISSLNEKDDNLTSVDNGFERGNMFNDLYKPYKNYRYAKLMPKTEKEKLLLDIMALSFAINDLNLYLDLHPEDLDILQKFRKYVEKSCELEMEYVKNYGPLEMIDNDSQNKFNWIKNPWPWENDGGVKYV